MATKNHLLTNHVTFFFRLQSWFKHYIPGIFCLCFTFCSVIRCYKKKIYFFSLVNEREIHSFSLKRSFCSIRVSVAKLKFWNGTKLELKEYSFVADGTFVKKIHTCIHIGLTLQSGLWLNFSHHLFCVC